MVDWLPDSPSPTRGNVLDFAHGRGRYDSASRRQCRNPEGDQPASQRGSNENPSRSLGQASRRAGEDRESNRQRCRLPQRTLPRRQRRYRAEEERRRKFRHGSSGEAVTLGAWREKVTGVTPATRPQPAIRATPAHVLGYQERAALLPGARALSPHGQVRQASSLSRQ